MCCVLIYFDELSAEVSLFSMTRSFCVTFSFDGRKTDGHIRISPLPSVVQTLSITILIVRPLRKLLKSKWISWLAAACADQIGYYHVKMVTRALL